MRPGRAPLAATAPALTRGRYGGFHVEQLVTGSGRRGTNHGAAGSRCAACRPTGAGWTRWSSAQTATVQPGMVRIYLIADGPTTVRFERDGGPRDTVAFRPTGRASPDGRVAPLKGSGNGLWSGTLPPPLAAGLDGRVVASGSVQPVDPLSRAVLAGFVPTLSPE